MKKIIFYPGPMHLFWTTGIYYLNELSKYYEVTLVLEKATKEDEEKINYLTEGRFKKVYHIKKANKLNRHREYKKVAIGLVNSIKPDLIFTDNDMYPFETYLLFQSKNVGSINICCQNGIAESTVSEQGKIWKGAAAAKIGKSLNIPISIAMLFVNYRCLLRHYWHYYVAPILLCHSPFMGQSSVYLHKGRPGMRDADYYIIFDEREKNIFLQDGVPEDKIIIISHPLTWKSNRLFKERYLNFSLSKINNPKILDSNVTIFFDNIYCDYAVSRETLKSIERREIYYTNKMMIEATSNKFPNSIIYLKPHPAQSIQEEFIRYISDVAKKLPNVKLVDKDVDGWNYVYKSRIIIGETTTLLYTASLYSEDKIIISFDLNKRILGDIYKNIENIIYITNIKDFIDLDISDVKNVKLEENAGAEKLKIFLYEISEM